MGREKARSIHHLSVENHRWMREWIDTHNSTCEYRQGGSLQLASSPEEEQELIESADLLLEDGFEAELLYGDELGEPYLNAGFQTGIVLPEDGEIHPAKFVQHVIQQAHQSGVQVYTHSPVSQIDSSDGVHLQTPSGSIKAHMAVLCTNAYLPQLMPTYQEIVHPVRGQMLCTTPQNRFSNAPFMPTMALTIGVRNLMDRLCWAAGETWTQTVRWVTQKPCTMDSRLHDPILRRFNGLGSVNIESRWSGIMGFSKMATSWWALSARNDNVLLRSWIYWARLWICMARRTQSDNDDHQHTRYLCRPMLSKTIRLSSHAQQSSFKPFS